MARGGARPGAGRPPKEAGSVPKVKNARAAKRPRKSLGGLSPLEYMLQVMNDEAAEDARRDRMAQAAAPYVHARKVAEEPGKKDRQKADAEKVVEDGKFAPRAGPKLAVDNG